MNKNKKNLNNSGFFLVNKPENITSSDLVQKIKRITKVTKIGHTGTLDKFAKGLLILPFGKYTSFASYFLESDKTYVAKVGFGKFTDSGDRDGNILKEVSFDSINAWLLQNRDNLIQEIQNFIYLKEQIPPKISALKISGQRQSDLFRKNIEFESKPRPIQIYFVNLVQMTNTSFTFEIKVSSGTYIRKLIIDLSEKLEFPFFLEELTRTQIGKLNLENANTIEDFELGNYKIYSPLEILDIPNILINEKEERQIKNGKKISISNPTSQFLFSNHKGEVIAWCEKQKESYKFLRVFP